MISSLLLLISALPYHLEFGPTDASDTIVLMQCDDKASCVAVFSHLYTEASSGTCDKNCCRIEQQLQTINLTEKPDGTWIDEERKITLQPEGKTEWLLKTPAGKWSTHAPPFKVTCNYMEPA